MFLFRERKLFMLLYPLRAELEEHSSQSARRNGENYEVKSSITLEYLPVSESS